MLGRMVVRAVAGGLTLVTVMVMLGLLFAMPKWAAIGLHLVALPAMAFWRRG